MRYNIGLEDFELDAAVLTLKEHFLRTGDETSALVAMSLLRAKNEHVAADRLLFDVRLERARREILEELEATSVERTANERQAHAAAALSKEEWETITALRAGKARVIASPAAIPSRTPAETVGLSTVRSTVGDILKEIAAKGDDKF